MISQGFQDALTELEVIAGQPCLCKASNGQCQSCLAQEELYSLYMDTTPIIRTFV